MKKWILGLALLLFSCLVLVYVLIPQTLPVSAVSFINCTPSATVRFLAENPDWKKWWPATGGLAREGVQDKDNMYRLGRDGFLATGRRTDAVEISIQDRSEILQSVASVLAFPGDSCVVRWETALHTDYNPLHRIREYRRALQIRNNMRSVLSALQQFLDNKENVYGQRLLKSSTVDTLLIAIRVELPFYPSTADIYRLVGILQDDAAREGAVVTGHPLLSTLLGENGLYNVMVALPVNRRLEGRGPVFFTRMVPGKFVVSEIRGGAGRVEEALAQIQHYFDDYKQTSMAIRFQSLVTDRTLEPDSSKWVTRLYAPVF